MIQKLAELDTGCETSAIATLEQRIQDRTALIGVVGLGYVGMPLVRAFVGGGFKTLGFDVDARKVARLQTGDCYIKSIPSSDVQQWMAEERFEATAEMERLSEADAILICVPTPLNQSRDPDLTCIEETTKAIAKCLRPGQLIVLESTTYPGTTRQVMLPILEAAGLVCGQDFLLAYSPEREDPGNAHFTASQIPKIVGGLDDRSRDAAVALYGSAVVKTIPVSSLEAAEAAKILENTYRAVNIALVNELKVLFDRMDIDVWEVIDAAKTKPFGFQAFYPGPGLGGHCIPIDPFYLTWLARCHGMTTRFIELAGEINTNMPHFVIQKLTSALNDCGRSVKNSRICVLGAAYKKDVDDPRESPSFELLKQLAALGAVVSYSDPHIPHLPPMRHYSLPAMSSQELTPEFLAAQDCVLIATDHSRFDYDHIVRHARLVVDTRNATRAVEFGRDKVVKA
ncbi:MAG: nucleotide sugar dehydrogenase [Pirellulales bacterium]